MDPSQANDQYMSSAFSFCLQRPNVCGGGGLRECGDTLERLSLVDDDAQWEEVPIKLPQEVFFSCQSCVQE